jgi:hypothetical protein
MPDPLSYSHAAVIAAIILRERTLSMIIPPIEEQFVSDAVNTIEGVTARDIAELWVDQNADRALTKAELDRAVDEVVPQLAYYLDGYQADHGEDGEAA